MEVIMTSTKIGGGVHGRIYDVSVRDVPET
jgi:hypothetical protein